MNLNNLLNIYGEDLLKYIFAIPIGEKLPEDEALLDKYSFNSLVRYIIENGPIMPLSVLFHPLPDYQILPVILHQKNSKQDLKIPDCKDELLNTLYKILSEIWPIFLYNPLFNDEHWPKYSIIISALTIALYGNPLLNSFCKLFLEDASLKKLFPEVDVKKISESSYEMVLGYWMTNLGNGGTQNFFNLIPSLLFEIASRCMMKEQDITYELLCKYVPDVISDWKKLAEGETIRTKCLIGFEGVSVDGEINIQCGSSVIRNPLKYELILLLEYDTPPQIVLEKEVELRIDVFPKDISSEKIKEQLANNRDKCDEAQVFLQTEIDRVKLSLLLASNLESNELLLPNENSYFIESPIHYGGKSFGEYKFKPNGGLLSKTMIKDIEFWGEHIVMDELKIAIKRLLSAAVKRFNPIDAFIDAIIVWESIFGAKTETTFRVTASISKLLEKDLEKRKKMQKDLKILYDKRSKLVHGEPEPSIEDVTLFKKMAINIAIEILKKLYKDRTDLIPYDSSLRSEIILLEKS